MLNIKGKVLEIYVQDYLRSVRPLASGAVEILFKFDNSPSTVLGVPKFKKIATESPTAFRGNAQKLFFNCSCFFIKSVRTMAATTSAAITAFEVEFLGKNFVTFGRKIVIFAFSQFIFLILLIHTLQSYKLLFRCFYSCQDI